MLDRVATPEEHAELARSVGWESHFDDRLRADALAASVAGVVCVDASGRVIGAARAVGAANGSNPVSIVVPCHRVIGRNGTMTGYAGGVQRKEWLLRHEGYLLL